MDPATNGTVAPASGPATAGASGYTIGVLEAIGVAAGCCIMLFAIAATAWRVAKKRAMKELEAATQSAPEVELEAVVITATANPLHAACGPLPLRRRCASVTSASEPDPQEIIRQGSVCSYVGRRESTGSVRSAAGDPCHPVPAPFRPTLPTVHSEAALLTAVSSVAAGMSRSGSNSDMPGNDGAEQPGSSRGVSPRYEDLGLPDEDAMF
jgi:hypothetical protein